jgi:hypothetical protein
MSRITVIVGVNEADNNKIGSLASHYVNQIHENYHVKF